MATIVSRNFRKINKIADVPFDLSNQSVSGFSTYTLQIDLLEKGYSHAALTFYLKPSAPVSAKRQRFPAFLIGNEDINQCAGLTYTLVEQIMGSFGGCIYLMEDWRPEGRWYNAEGLLSSGYYAAEQSPTMRINSMVILGQNVEVEFENLTSAARTLHLKGVVHAFK